MDAKDRDTSAEWKPLYRAGGLAALAAGVLIRRNIAAEVSLFSGQTTPATAVDWFALLQNNRLLGLIELNLLDVVNYMLLAVMFLALYAVLQHRHRSGMLVVLALGLLGIGVYLTSNTALSMLALSQQYASAVSEAQRTNLAAAGEALMALGRFTNPNAQPGSAGYVSLLLVALAGMITSVIMLRSKVFSRMTAIAGILANGLDLAYSTAFAFLPAADPYLLSVLFIPAAGLGYMVWHILVGWRLVRLSKETQPGPVSSMAGYVQG